MRFQSYFNTATKIIQLHDGALPLQHFLKQYFAHHKKHGSKDRKIITHLCYNFYRLGKAFINFNIEEKLKLAIFICNDTIEDWKFLYQDEWLNNHSKTLDERLAFIQIKYAFLPDNVFPYKNETSKSLNNETFTKSFFIQPDVFLRIRPGYENTVINKLQQHNIRFNNIEENCISLFPSTNISTIINIDEEAVIQDYSSQKIKAFLRMIQSIAGDKKSGIKVWDCCAGSGGKSLLAYDTIKNIELTASDIRPSIIQNLKQRFAKAHVKNYKAAVSDLANKSQIPNSRYLVTNSTYDVIICDAPCTGSGTWSRTPEQLFFFESKKIDEYALRQQKIISNAIQSLTNNGFFLYITCSVFEKENEAIADFIRQQFELELLNMELIKGYDKKADTMFAALFRKVTIL